MHLRGLSSNSTSEYCCSQHERGPKPQQQERVARSSRFKVARATNVMRVRQALRPALGCLKATGATQPYNIPVNSIYTSEAFT